MRKQTGAYLFLMAFGVVILLGVAGLVIDLANIYNAKVQIQKAADAGVLAALKFRTERGPPTNLCEDFDGSGPEPGNPRGCDDISGDGIIDTSPSGPDSYTEKFIQNLAREVAKKNLYENLRSLKNPSLYDGKRSGGNREIPDQDNDSLEDDEDDIDVNIRNVQPGGAGTTINSVNITVNINTRIKMFLMNAVPFDIFRTDGSGAGIGDVMDLKSDATAQINPAYVSLMLDMSNSMLCPANLPINYNPALKCPNITRAQIDNGEVYCPCSCRRIIASIVDGKPNYVDNDSGSGAFPCTAGSVSDIQVTKLGALIGSVHNFLKKFTPLKDRISIIPFNLSSHVYKSFQETFQKSDLDAWDPEKASEPNSIYNLVLDSIPGPSPAPADADNPMKLGEWTNPSDAFLTAFDDNFRFHSEQNDDADPSTADCCDNQRTYYVFFTDGAPTAGRFFLNGSGTEFASKSPVNSSSFSYYQLLHPNARSASGHYTQLSSFYPYGLSYGFRRVDRGPSARFGGRPGVWGPSAFYPSPLSFYTEPPAPPNLPSDNLFYGLTGTTYYSATRNVSENPYNRPNCSQELPPTTTGDDFSARESNTAVTYCNCLTTYTGDPIGECQNILNFIDPRSGRVIGHDPFGLGQYSELVEWQMTLLDDEGEPISGAPIRRLFALNQPYISSDYQPDQYYYIEQYYNAAIAYADFIRANNGVIFGVGFGPQDTRVNTVGLGPDPSPAPLSDYNYLTVKDPNSRKDYFLARLAFATSSPFSGKDFPIGSPGPNPNPIGLLNWSDLPGNFPNQEGLYMPAENSAELFKAFDDIGNYIIQITK